MAYRDENGRITIDEVAAQADINKVVQAQEILQNALNGLRAAKAEAEASKGSTAGAIRDKSAELIAAIQELDGRLEETAAYIRHVVAVYQEKDRRLKEMIQNGGTGGQ